MQLAAGQPDRICIVRLEIGLAVETGIGKGTRLLGQVQALQLCTDGSVEALGTLGRAPADHVKYRRFRKQA